MGFSHFKSFKSVRPFNFGCFISQKDVSVQAVTFPQTFRFPRDCITYVLEQVVYFNAPTLLVMYSNSRDTVFIAQFVVSVNAPHKLSGVRFVVNISNQLAVLKHLARPVLVASCHKYHKPSRLGAHDTSKLTETLNLTIQVSLLPTGLMTSSESIRIGEPVETTSNIMSCIPFLRDVLFVQFTSAQFVSLDHLTIQRDRLLQIISRDRQ